MGYENQYTGEIEVPERLKGKEIQYGTYKEYSPSKFDIQSTIDGIMAKAPDDIKDMLSNLICTILDNGYWPDLNSIEIVYKEPTETNFPIVDGFTREEPFTLGVKMKGRKEIEEDGREADRDHEHAVQAGTAVD